MENLKNKIIRESKIKMVSWILGMSLSHMESCYTNFFTIC